MQRTKKLFLLSGIGLAILIGALIFFLFVKTEPKATARQSAQTVRTVIAEKKTIPLTIQANGYVTAINTVDVRPRAQNIVRVIHVKEGQFVKAGQLLITLDDRSDLSNLARARAEAEASRADLLDAEMILKRNQELLARKFVSQAVVDTARNKVESLRRTMQANQAAAQASAVALGYNQISASISGRIGLISVHPGSLAQPSGDAMLTITQIDPITVSFSVPERELANVAASYASGVVAVTAQIPGREAVDGKLIFIDNAVDTQTGTIRMKAEFDNAKKRLWPGTFVNVSLVSRTVDAVSVPVQAVVTGPLDKFVYAVQKDNTVVQKKVTVNAVENGQAAVTGLLAGDRIVVEGLQNLRPGGKIKEAKKMTSAEEKEANRFADKAMGGS
jgi:RND family efflux transporter MFP subunit